MIATPYALPYAVYHSPLPVMSLGQNVFITVSFAGGINAEGTKNAESLITTFFHLAGSGALSGAAIAPWDSTVSGVDFFGGTGSNATWRLSNIRVDERSIPIISQLFLVTHSDFPIGMVTINGGPDERTLIALPATNEDRGIYPAIFASQASRVEISPDLSDDIVVIAHFASDPTVAQREAIRLKIEDWIAASAIGCYPAPPHRPDFCSLEYDGALDFFEAELQIGFRNFYCHREALYGLCNSLFSVNDKAPELARIIIT
ncbi:hypothetical protein FJ420_14645 [Mesorhizobium sp. B3-1-3]|uniref:hypothetical protein n=1 Tax=unclassified Mesorhizobium TaxID=325217 RepID=UPI00112EE337|nr:MULTISPECIES: hypothetical protein [unclassified Mesorhizobium]TPI65663.1 hypothetical protein FJ424_15030 [Mesorhizobium sp. B3-1-8]TPI71748.1 hypothetical protein FJ420_14645 [Mesorhizobium sp. B3-1-3]